MIPVGEYWAVSHQLYQMTGPSSCALGLTGETAARLKWLHSPLNTSALQAEGEVTNLLHSNLIGDKMLARESPPPSHPRQQWGCVPPLFLRRQSPERQVHLEGASVKLKLFLSYSRS